jgi:hypothetical protein
LGPEFPAPDGPAFGALARLGFVRWDHDPTIGRIGPFPQPGLAALNSTVAPADRRADYTAAMIRLMFSGAKNSDIGTVPAIIPR